MDQQKTGCFLKELRKAKNLTQEQLAERLNISGRTVSRWETGNNMPDISLLVELAELYDVSIPEIIDGERKSETMEKEVKEVAEKMSDYAGTEKETLIKNIRNLSLMGVCALAVYFLLNVTGAALQNAILESIYLYCQTLIYVTTLLIPLYTTGLLGKFEQKKRAKDLTACSDLSGSFYASLVRSPSRQSFKYFYQIFRSSDPRPDCARFMKQSLSASAILSEGRRPP